MVFDHFGTFQYSYCRFWQRAFAFIISDQTRLYLIDHLGHLKYLLSGTLG